MSPSANKLWIAGQEGDSQELRFEPAAAVTVRRSLETALTALLEENESPIEDVCTTPRSEQHRIPKILSCPPAPKKPRPAAPHPYKRKSPSELRSVDPREIESFFEDNQLVNPPRIKKSRGYYKKE